MKTKVLLIGLLILGFSSLEAQNQTTVYAKNSDISDNLDLRAVASIFGESANLQDFERRLNDPKYQISNLDLNDDDEVDYLRVIETVEDRTHVVIIQAVLDRDVYQDVATIDVEKDNYDRVSVQVVGNSYLYGSNYIYEPVYNVTPVIYSSFWVTNYRPYCSTWSWGFFPSYYVAWRPFPIFRYRNNINICINVNNRYNYVSHRRSYVAPVLYESRRCYAYERQHPNYGFSQRHINTNNRYDLDQRRVSNREYYRNQNNNIRSNPGRVSVYDNRTPNRNYYESRNINNRSNNSNRVVSNNGYSTRPNPVRTENTSRGYSNDNKMSSSNGGTASRPSGNNSVPSQRNESSKNIAYSRQSSENRSASPRPQNTQRSDNQGSGQESRSGGQSHRENNSESRGGGRRG